MKVCVFLSLIAFGQTVIDLHGYFLCVTLHLRVLINSSVVWLISHPPIRKYIITIHGCWLKPHKMLSNYFCYRICSVMRLTLKWIQSNLKQFRFVIFLKGQFVNVRLILPGFKKTKTVYCIVSCLKVIKGMFE